MADRYRGPRYDRGDEPNRGMFYDRDRGGLYGGRDPRWRDDVAGFRGTGYLGGDYGQARTDRDWTERESEPIQPSYRGRGPKNYRRSDERIHEDVCERLERDDRVDASDVEVNVNDGIVMMVGTVPDRDMKRRAEDLAESVGGVRDVQNQIHVARSDR
jgi:osmotically-inducible protein OsmY